MFSELQVFFWALKSYYCTQHKFFYQRHHEIQPSLPCVSSFELSSLCHSHHLKFSSRVCSSKKLSCYIAAFSLNLAELWMFPKFSPSTVCESYTRLRNSNVRTLVSSTVAICFAGWITMYGPTIVSFCYSDGFYNTFFFWRARVTTNCLSTNAQWLSAKLLLVLYLLFVLFLGRSLALLNLTSKFWVSLN